MAERIGHLIGYCVLGPIVAIGARLGIPACRRIIAEVQEQHRG